jgi:capsule polysaccharide export protein KpsE/RkpR
MKMNEYKLFKVEKRNIPIFIVANCLVITVVLVFVILVAKKQYKSDAMLLPLSGAERGLLDNVSGLAGLIGLGAGGDDNVLNLILKSRTFLDKVARDLKLVDRWGCSKQEAVLRLKKHHLSVEESSRSRELKLFWVANDPKFSKKALDRVIEIARQTLEDHENSKRNQKVEFLEKRVLEARGELKNSEDSLKEFQEKNQSMKIENQAILLVEQLSELKKQHQEQTIELAVAKKIIHEEASELKILKYKIEEIEKRMSELVGEKSEMITSKLADRTLMEIPKLSIEFGRLLRKVTINQKIYGILIEQLEISRIESQKNIETFELIDSPVVPEKPFAPNKRLYLMISVLLTNFLLVFIFSIINQRKLNAGEAASELRKT